MPGSTPPKPDFSGTYRFDAARSVLQIPAPDATLFVIEHDEPRFRLTRTHVSGGTSDTFSIELATDGVPVEGKVGDLEMHARLYWDGGILVFDTTLTRGADRGTNLVRYRLEDGGRTIVAEERFRSERLVYENRWLLAREPEGSS